MVARPLMYNRAHDPMNSSRALMIPQSLFKNLNRDGIWQLFGTSYVMINRTNYSSLSPLCSSLLSLEQCLRLDALAPYAMPP